MTLWAGGHPLVLASQSGSRRAVLAATGIPFECCPAAIDERALEAPLRDAGATAGAIATHLARAKALAVSPMHAASLVIGADQTLTCDSRMFVKPRDQAEAAAQLAALSGRTHELHAALCVVRAGSILFETAPVARLTCRALTETFIARYLAAAGAGVLASVGAYQVEGLGIHLFDRIEGDHTTILGLPLMPLLRFLRAEGSLLG